jgi:predicted  nucleic acid-binding Zn-ribbon protein
MFFVRQNLINGDHRQKGVSLLTIALLLLLLGGALMAGINYFRAQIPSSAASSQKEALAWADRAIIGFASIHHRLPCPAATPAGDEDCSLAKGWLPTKALNLDATMYQPGLLPMRYMVYRNPTVSGGSGFTADLAVSVGSFEPSAWDGGAESDGNEIRDSGSHNGRYVSRYDFNVLNCLDMCETMRLAYVQQVSAGPSASYAHYRRGILGTVVNVAYGIAAPGLGDASNNNDRFDGANAGATAQMEPPDRAHGYNYNDYVFVRDLPSLMSAFGCQPVHYTVTQDRTDSTASGSFGGSLTGIIADTIELVGGVINYTPSDVHVAYDREGVASPMPSTVQSVALAVEVIKEVESLYDFVKGAAEQALAFAIVQAVLASAGIAVSTVKIIAGAIGIAEAAGIAAACLGLCVNQYVAIAFYSAEIVTSTIALAVNVAALGTLIGGTVQAGLVVSRLGGDDTLIDRFCDATSQDPEVESKIQEALEKTEKDLEKAVRDAKNAMDRAYAKLGGFESVVDACYERLRQAVTETTPPLFVGTSQCTNPASFTYEKCGFTAIGDAYEKFYSKGGRDDLFKKKYDAEKKLEETKEKISNLNKEIDETDVSKPAVQAQINNSVDAYRNTLSHLDPARVEEACAKFKNDLIAQYNKRNLDATNERNALTASLPGLESDIQNAKQAIDAAVNALPAAVSNQTDKCNNPAGDVSIPCNGKYSSLCDSARVAIKSEYWRLNYGSAPDCFLATMQTNNNICNDYNYYSAWLEYYRKKELYEEALARYNNFMANKPSTGGFSCAKGMDGKVLMFPVNAAVDILRKVDKRSVLQ